MQAVGRLVSASFDQRSSTRRVVAWLLALLGPALLTVAAVPLRSRLGLAGFLFFTLLVVIVVAVTGGVRPALTAVAVGFLAGAFFFAPPYSSLSVHLRLDNAPLLIYAVVGVIVGILVDELATLVQEQTALRRVEAALRRVATLVARGVPPDELFAAATEEVGNLLGVDRASLSRFAADGTASTLASWSSAPELGPVDAEADTSATIATPIIVDAHRWGMMSATILQRPLGAQAQTRLESFTELLATAIANAQSRDELAASRARVVAAADDTRRRIERDLHDGAQQRLVSLTLDLRTAQKAVPPQLSDLGQDLSAVADALSDVMDELREFARGIHPAILAEGGIGPALRTLARRSPVPVQLDVNAESRLPEHVEVATYYVVSEALTNTAKHAQASVVHVVVASLGHALTVSVRDDGAGGADPGGGSGLTGLRDRVQALGGSLTVRSAVGAGTQIEVEIPLLDQG